jgi:hypothetical protein
MPHLDLLHRAVTRDLGTVRLPDGVTYPVRELSSIGWDLVESIKRQEFGDDMRVFNAALRAEVARCTGAPDAAIAPLTVAELLQLLAQASGRLEAVQAALAVLEPAQAAAGEATAPTATATPTAPPVSPSPTSPSA